ncbi:MAG: winged helix-turn-helix transcriptional regulator [Candidatus Thermoplasmatota archaeon]|nr:winged helix-turn-helix transcriptional regulator [Candidatus Thermoplasmatota archaeon]
MVKKEVLDLETRRKVYNFISCHPGLHLSELSRKLDIPVSTINYHLGYLKKLGTLVAKHEGRYVRYYIPQKIGVSDKKIINLLRHDTPFRIVMYLMQNPNSSQICISKYLKRHPTTISFHLDKLLEADIIEYTPNGTELQYKIKNEPELIDLFTKYGDSLLDDLNNNG